MFKSLPVTTHCQKAQAVFTRIKKMYKLQRQQQNEYCWSLAKGNEPQDLCELTAYACARDN